MILELTLIIRLKILIMIDQLDNENHLFRSNKTQILVFYYTMSKFIYQVRKVKSMPTEWQFFSYRFELPINFLSCVKKHENISILHSFEQIQPK